jgi:hypothetical protein
MYCAHCGSNQHAIALCPSTWRGSAARRHLRCSYCGATDHNISACPKTWRGNAARAWHEDAVTNDFVKDPHRT